MRFKRNFRPTEPSNGRRDFGKVKGARGRGFFYPDEGDRSQTKTHLALSLITLLLSLCFASAIVILNAPFFEDRIREFAGTTAIMFFFAAHFFIFVTEFFRSTELKFRKLIVFCLWGMVLLGFLVGMIF